MELKKVMFSTIIILTIISVLYFLLIEFNIKILIEHIVIDFILVYLTYKWLKNYPSQKVKWTKSLIAVAILSYTAFFSMVIGFLLLAYSLLQQNKTLTLIAMIIIGIFFLFTLLLLVFGMYRSNKRYFKAYLITIFIWIVVIVLNGVFMRNLQSTELLIVFFALSICLLIFIFMFPLIAIIVSKKKKFH